MRSAPRLGKDIKMSGTSVGDHSQKMALRENSATRIFEIARPLLSVPDVDQKKAWRSARDLSDFLFERFSVDQINTMVDAVTDPSFDILPHLDLVVAAFRR